MRVVDTGSPAGSVRVSVMTEKDGSGAACVVDSPVASTTASTATRRATEPEVGSHMLSEVKGSLRVLYSRLCRSKTDENE